ncbi:NAD(P)-binding protein [Starkeya sp. ORNL1]|uniref:GMC family oxidoreductase n=1 Tax=Starkeya sp. ORNL1 TaxID=2709380 RepID=UPI001463E83E|nr:GMC family oxidoreductase N-terminal domain-containing protein [Starkeya sp. ORNL1]QJP14230.1 NAD(P)-binding protein [Starkeya sp. ORNL1]
MVDYIVVGGGSAGCVTASRLSEDPGVSVVLIEQGPRDWNPYIHMPVTYYKTAKGNLLSRYTLAPVKQQGNITPTMVQGRVLGGGSSVNAMVYIRGCPQDYDGWVAAGADGWSYREVLPFFKRAEDNERFSNEAHGTGGPLGVSDQRYTHPLTKAWLKACQEAGLPFNPDFNSGSQAGCGLYQLTTRDGRRSSAAVAYLHPAEKRRNLTVKTSQQVTRIVIEKGRAVGVEYVEGGRKVVLRAEREVILCSGAIGSPRLLLLSGIGPAEHLRSVGVPVAHDLKGVGRNLQDHMDMYMIYQLKGADSYDKYKKLHWQLWAGLEYALFRTGPVTSNVCEGGLFWWGHKSDPLPDLQYHFLPGAGVEAGVGDVPGGNGCTLNICQTRPRSRGTITLRSADPADQPVIDPNYLAEPYDMDCLIEGVKVAQEIMAKPAIKAFIAREHLPGRPLSTRADYEAFVRKEAQGAIHPCGACRMGTDDMAVVDPQLRVHGIDGLRVADTSIMPNLISGNTNAPAIMIGERVADFIRGNRAAQEAA